MFWDFPGDPVVKIPPCNAGNVSSMPGWGTKIPHAKELLRESFPRQVDRKSRGPQGERGSPNGGNSLQVSDIFISLKRQEETN